VPTLFGFTFQGLHEEKWKILPARRRTFLLTIQISICKLPYKAIKTFNCWTKWCKCLQLKALNFISWVALTLRIHSHIKLVVTTKDSYCFGLFRHLHAPWLRYLGSGNLLRHKTKVDGWSVMNNLLKTVIEFNFRIIYIKQLTRDSPDFIHVSPLFRITCNVSLSLYNYFNGHKMR